MSEAPFSFVAVLIAYLALAVFCLIVSWDLVIWAARARPFRRFVPIARVLTGAGEVRGPTWAVSDMGRAALRRPFVYVRIDGVTLAARMPENATEVLVECDLVDSVGVGLEKFERFGVCLEEALGALAIQPRPGRSPILLVHLLPSLTIGRTDVEMQAIKHAAQRVGAKKVWFVTDWAPLTDVELTQCRKLFS
jgi:hypothetical protein